MAIAPGSRFDRYEVLAPIGAGGMGEVYLAQDARLGRKVALKLLPAAFTQDAARVRRFEQEARAASALNHPNIITIHEIGEASLENGGVHFIATEFIEGETLRQRLRGQPLPAAATLNIATQIAAALAAAHAAGIIHRDIKPENVMVRTDGYVKVLDFGLAKLTEVRKAEGGTRNEEADTLLQIPKDNPQSAIRNPQLTDPDAVMGTPQYMSPEQARGEELDARSDIFSLGIVLYEMLAGRAPFEGVNALDVISAILRTEPAPLRQHAPELNHELERIVGKALRKDREERYQHVKDLLIDLNDLRRELEFEEKLKSKTAREMPRAEATANLPPAPVTEPVQPVANTTSVQFQIPRRALRIGLAVVVLAVLAGSLFYFLRPKPALTDKDTILLADFTNTTGDAVFDGTLRQGLAVQLQQSPFLSLFPDERIRATLRLMNKAPDERVTRAVGREIALRQGVKAVLAGTIVNLGRNYSLTLEALNSQSGETLALVQTEAEGVEQVLKALSQAATQMREKLGESLASIRKFDAPLEVTTSSLEALKVYSIGADRYWRDSNALEAIPFFKRAVELDPDFAMAYTALAVMYLNTSQEGLAAEYSEKGYALKERVSEYERLRILYYYHLLAIGDVYKTIEVLELTRRTYPRDALTIGGLSYRHHEIGQFEKDAEEAREGMRLGPNYAVMYERLGEALLCLNRFAEAKENFEQELRQNIGGADPHHYLFKIAFVNADAAALQQQLDWASGQPDDYDMLDLQAEVAAFAGQWKKAQEFSRRMINSTRSDLQAIAAAYAGAQALRAAALNQTTEAKTLVTQSLVVERNQWKLSNAALALALSGYSAQAQPLVDELVKRYPQDTLINGLWLPTINAALELQRGNAQAAITLLEAAKRYEPAAEFWPQYVRGLAYLKLNQAPAAAAEFQKILDHRGEASLSVLWPLAHLGLSRAAMLQGDTAKARKSYQDFLALWKDADADLPVLIEAKKEYEKLK